MKICSKIFQQILYVKYILDPLLSNKMKQFENTFAYQKLL